MGEVPHFEGSQPTEGLTRITGLPAKLTDWRDEIGFT